jgi:hypothetical protein
MTASPYENMDTPHHLAQLFAGALWAARFADDPTTAHQSLIGADDDAVRIFRDKRN